MGEHCKDVGDGREGLAEGGFCTISRWTFRLIHRLSFFSLLWHDSGLKMVVEYDVPTAQSFDFSNSQ